MKTPAMITAELRRLTSTKMGILALIALLFVPVLYGGLYLWANQDPYGNLDQVPVGLVVADTGVAASGDQPAVNYGDRVAENLLKDGTFDWRTLTPDAAAAALADGDVDFTVTLPADFSAALTSATGAHPRQATLVLQTNDANNYLASTIGDQATERIRRSVAELVGRESASRMLTAISDIRGQLVTAADGATQLTDGAATAHTGAATLTDGAKDLAHGTATLADGAHQVADGAAQLAPGAQDLAQGAGQVASGVDEIAGYADRAGAASRSAVDALPKARADLAARLAAQDLTPSQIDKVLTALDPLADAVRDGDSHVQNAVGQIDRLDAGARQVATGAGSLAAASRTLAAGATQVASGADAAADGAEKLQAGAGTLTKGLGTLKTGAAALADGLHDGVAQIPASTAAQRTQQAKTIADPVAVTEAKVAAAQNYGAGLAPFFAALAGWIGIYALFLIVKPISKRAVTALHSPIRVTVAGWLTPSLLGALQMGGLFLILSAALGFGFAHPWATLGVMVAASFTYAAIILALNVWFGSVGEFLGLVLMVLQLVAAGGTFPWQTLPGPLLALHRVLPMGFVVDAMRQFMYGGDIARVGQDLAVMAVWLIAALALSALGVARMTHRRTLRDLAPSLIG